MFLKRNRQRCLKIDNQALKQAVKQSSSEKKYFFFHGENWLKHGWTSTIFLIRQFLCF